MAIPLVIFALPIWLCLIFWEVGRSLSKKDGNVRFNDAIASLSCGLVSRIPRYFLAHVLTAPYQYINENYRVTDLFSQHNLITAILIILTTDLCYYWAHRLSHMINFAWGGHVVHHSSEEYNFTTALRQSFFEPIVTTPVYFVAALFFPFEHFSFYSELNTIFQFFVHTKYVRKLWGPIEFILNTPSHHRCHHGRNPIYIDKNFGGMFIIWDRIFGTYEEEEEEPVFGIVTPLDSWNPLWASVHHLVHVFNTAIEAPGFTNKIKVFTSSPAFNPFGPDFDLPPVRADKVRKYDTRIPPVLKSYILVHFLLAFASSVFLAVHPDMKTLPMIGFAAYLLFTLQSIGMMLDLKRYSLRVELIRNLSIGMVFVGLVLNYSKIAAALVATISVFSAGFVSVAIIRHWIQFGNDQIITPVNYLLEELETKEKQE
eukprot:gb/GECH01014558.1/.p1 GENE.gb/GECH01014558.1/~~gb/GECH01014558.1/.p1  ORF type:complete len:428 (+),score=75.31 gb/GECH01014558.1/:1-1284(+)